MAGAFKGGAALFFSWSFLRLFLCFSYTFLILFLCFKRKEKEKKRPRKDKKRKRKGKEKTKKRQEKTRKARERQSVEPTPQLPVAHTTHPRPRSRLSTSPASPTHIAPTPAHDLVIYLEHPPETRCSIIALDDHQSCSPTVPPTPKDGLGVVLRSICDQVLAGQP